VVRQARWDQQDADRRERQHRYDTHPGLLAALEKCAAIPCFEYRQNNTDCIVWAAEPCGPCMARAAIAAEKKVHA
jgi:hypothetical protein